MSFYIDEEEKEHLLPKNTPEIVVDPPSRDESEVDEKDSKMWSHWQAPHLIFSPK